MDTVKVKLGERGYPIYIGHGLLKQSGRLMKKFNFGSRVEVITHPELKELFAKTLTGSLSETGIQPSFITVPQGESSKRLGAAAKIYEELTEHGAERGTPILALGGGVIGDLAGFVAATYLRGVPLVHIPTTLLAQADSSIGGKTGVDHGSLKNRVGVFYQPRLVISDTATLASLDQSQYEDGLAEVIKHAAIKDSAFFSYLEKNMPQIKEREAGAVTRVVIVNARIKAGIIAKDERDGDLRNILNYGHTIGHALESVSGFSLSHGHAVAMGMYLAGELAERKGLLHRDELARLGKLLESAGLPRRFPDINAESVIESLKHDKKVKSGKLRMVLLSRIGKTSWPVEISISDLEGVIGKTG